MVNVNLTLNVKPGRAPDLPTYQPMTQLSTKRSSSISSSCLCFWANSAILCTRCSSFMFTQLHFSCLGAQRSTRSPSLSQLHILPCSCSRPSWLVWSGPHLCHSWVRQSFCSPTFGRSSFGRKTTKPGGWTTQIHVSSPSSTLLVPTTRTWTPSSTSIWPVCCSRYLQFTICQEKETFNGLYSSEWN